MNTSIIKRAETTNAIFSDEKYKEISEYLKKINFSNSLERLIQKENELKIERENIKKTLKTLERDLEKLRACKDYCRFANYVYSKEKRAEFERFLIEAIQKLYKEQEENICSLSEIDDLIDKYSFYAENTEN